MKNNKLFSKVIDYTLNVLIVLFAIFLLISMYTFFQVKVLGNKYSDFFGYSLFEVQTGSMHGTIEAGDWIVVNSHSDVKVGDIVTYKHGNDFVTHRIIESYKGTYVTKGDANNAKDDPIDQSQIIGKVVKTFHGFGILRKTIFNPIVILFLIITLYLFNLTFKPGKTKFDKNVERVIKILKQKLFNKKGNIKSEKVKVVIDSPIKEEKNVESVITSKPEPELNMIISVPKEEPIEAKENVEVKEPEKESEAEEKVQEKKSEEDLSKTAMFRMISIQPDEKPKYYKETEEIKDEEVIDPDDLSKTAMFRVISADSHDVDNKENKVALKQKEKFTEVVNFSLNAELIEEPIKEKKITQEYIDEKIKNKKAKNILDKLFVVKKIIYDEILDVLLKESKSYIMKSPMRNEFITEYMNSKFFSFEADRKNIKENIKSFSNDLIAKNIRDEKKVNTINAYTDCFNFISTIEDKKSVNYVEEIKKLFDYDDEIIENMAFDIENIINFSNDNLSNILDKLDTKTFEVKYNKIVGQKSLYGVVLVYVPNALYGKDKKLDKIISTLDNEYAKSHVYILTSVSNMLSNKDDIKRLRKKGYGFAVAFNKRVEIKNDDMGYIYMADYYFMDSYLDADNICELIPTDIIKNIIKDNISKKIGDYGGE